MSIRARFMALVLAAVICISSVGCFGSFNLTRTVYNFNNDVSEQKWVKEVVFLGLLFVPVYGVASFVDAIVVNSIEFWTGDNPVSVDGEDEIAD